MPLEEIRRGLSRIELEMPAVGESTPFLRLRFNVYAIKTDSGISLFDCGSEYSIKQLSSSLDPNERIRNIFLTHGHADHSGSAAYWLKREAKIFASHAEGDMLRSGGPHNVPGPFRYTGFEPTGIIEPGKTIKVGDYEFLPLATPGHTGGSLCFYDVQHDILICGDLLFGPFRGRYLVTLGAQLMTLSMQTKTALQQQLESIDELIRDNIIKSTTLILPGHGSPCYLRGKLNRVVCTRAFIHLFQPFRPASV